MTDFSLPAKAIRAKAAAMSPAGIQQLSVLTGRRAAFACAFLAVFTALAYGMFLSLGLDKSAWSLPETAIFLLSLLALPWFVMGLCNAAIGLWLLRSRAGLYEAAPFWRVADEEIEISSRVAIIM